MARNEEEHILNIQVSYDKAVEGIKKYRDEIVNLTIREKELAQELEDGKISQQEYDKELEIGKVAQKNYRDEIRALQKEIQNNIRQEQQMEGSLKSLRAELSNATKKYDELSRAERESAKGKELQQHIKDITEELKGAEAETDRFYRNVGNYKNSIIEALTGNNRFASSLAGIAQEGGGSIKGFFSTAVTSVKSFGAALMSLLANPVFLGIAGIAGAGVAFKWFYDYNQGLAEATRLTQQFTGKSGEDLKQFRNGVQAVADAFGLEFQETLQSANAMAKGFGISVDEALKLMQDGLVSGANANGEFLDTVKEYPAYFKEAGISAEGFVAITTQATKQGIFSDKGVDTIKEANIRLREMTTATASALDGIGISSKTVQKELQSGSKTTFDIMQQVSAKLKELPQTSSAVGTAIADIFGGPGEDAGLAYIESLSTIQTNLGKVKDGAGEVASAQEQQIEAQKELNNTMSAMFDMTGGGFESMKAQISTIATKTLVAMMKGVAGVVNWFVRLYNKSLIVRAGVLAVAYQFKVLWSAVKLVFNLIIDGFKGIGRALELFVDTTKAAFRAVVGAAQGFGKVLSGIANFSLEEIKAGVAEIKNSVVGGFKSALTSLKGTIKAQGREVLGDIASFGKETFDNFKQGFNEAVNGGGLKEITFDVAASGAVPTNADISPVSHGKGATPTSAGATDKKPTGGKTGKNNGTGNGNGPSAEQLAADELAQVRKAEEMLLQLIEDNAEKQRALLKNKYDQQIADLERALAEKGKHTAKAEEAMTVQIKALQQQREMELNKLELQFTKQRVEQENKKYALLIEAAKAGTREQYDLQLAKLTNEQQLAEAEIVATLTNEQQRQEMLLANDAAFEARRLELKKKYLQEERAAQQQAITEQFANDIQGAEQGGDELGALQLKLDQKRAMMDAANAAEYESEKAKQEAILQASNEFYQAQQDLSDKRREIEVANSEAIAGAIGSLQGVMEAFGSKNKTLTALSKVLALAQIAISSGVALAKGIEQSQSVPFPQNITAIATTVGTILANIATAIKTVKGAKMAVGGVVRGRGTGTSDQVPIHASNGESVMTAEATSMFSPALSAFNQLGGGVPIVVQSPAQQLGEEFLAAAFAKGMALAPRPVVTVEEINKVQERVNVLEQLGNI